MLNVRRIVTAMASGPRGSRHSLSTWKGLLTLISAGFLFWGCGSPEIEQPGASGRERITVVTAILPITLFSKAVAGDCAEVLSLTSNQDVHNYQARPADLLTLRRARVLVKNGLGIEGFLDKMIAASGNPKLTVVETSLGISTLATGSEPASHHHDDHHHGPLDPHIWLDPQRAVQQVLTIRDSLVEADPSCAASYRRNAEDYVTRLRQLDRDLSTQLAPYRGRPVVMSHAFGAYFADRYALKLEPLVDQPEQQPTPADLQRVTKTVENAELQAVLATPGESGSLQALANDLSIPVLVFDPLETAAAAAAQDPETYLTVMRSNAASVRSAFRASRRQASLKP